MINNAAQFGQADLTDCDREAIRIPGSIQPHGVLLALDATTLKIVQIAGDTQRLFGLSVAELIEKDLAAQLGSAASLQVERLVRNDELLPRPFFVVEAAVAGNMFDVSAHVSGGLVVLELEKHQANPPEDGVALVHKMMGGVQAATNLGDLFNAILHEVQQSTGFERAMLYRFADDDSGHVVAERRNLDVVDSFLDLHYPASDIPVQARELYCSCWVRYIPDTRYVPERLMPENNPSNGQPLDLSFSLLRSVSPIHLEYLANMGVAASMSLSVVVDGKLWGLIACHHSEPLHLSCHVRAALELFAQLASLQLKTRLELDLAEHRVGSGDLLAQLVASMTTGDLSSLLTEQPNLLDLIDAGGVAVILDGTIATLGSTPSAAQLQALAIWLNAEMGDGIFTTHHLAARYPPAHDFMASAAGLLSLSISRSPGDIILWFLPEVIGTVTWGGKPTKLLTSGPHGDRLTPRKSFEAWTETVTSMSRPWLAHEIQAAAVLRVSILEVVLERMDQVARARDESRAHQDLLMAELDHRVKNTLATIQALVRSSSRNATDLISYTRALERRLGSMAKAHNLLTASRWLGASVRRLVEDEISPYRPIGHPMISIMGRDVDLEPKAAIMVSLCLHELATNATKYGALSVEDGAVAVSWSKTMRDGLAWLSVSWSETGGPPVALPERSGFGRTLLESAFAYEVKGRVLLDFRPSGVTCELLMPYDRVVERRETRQRPSGPSRRSVPSPLDAKASLAGVRIFVAEDGALIAHALVRLLKAAGAEVVGPFATVSDAMVPAREERFDIAMLDIDLHGKQVWPVAEVILGRGIPFAFCTGFANASAWPTAFQTSLSIDKPYNARELVVTLVAMIPRLAAQGALKSP
jgi:chemotaxis family two-component system sensor kinase Cph1